MEPRLRENIPVKDLFIKSLVFYVLIAVYVCRVENYHSFCSIKKLKMSIPIWAKGLK